jgi:hypothetical protein
MACCSFELLSFCFCLLLQRCKGLRRLVVASSMCILNEYVLGIASCVCYLSLFAGFHLVLDSYLRVFALSLLLLHL